MCAFCFPRVSLAVNLWDTVCKKCFYFSQMQPVLNVNSLCRFNHLAFIIRQAGFETCCLYKSRQWFENLFFFHSYMLVFFIFHQARSSWIHPLNLFLPSLLDASVKLHVTSPTFDCPSLGQSYSPLAAVNMTLPLCCGRLNILKRPWRVCENSWLHSNHKPVLVSSWKGSEQVKSWVSCGHGRELCLHVPFL